MGIGKIYATIVDVNDLDVAEEFWTELTGLETIADHGRFRYLGTTEPRKGVMALQLVDRQKGTDPNRVHFDIDVETTIDDAVERVVAMGGSLKKEPNLYPRPGKIDGARPVADWAVMQDPFGNEFCIIAPITREQSEAAMMAYEAGETDDHALRVAAGVTAQLSK